MYDSKTLKIKVQNEVFIMYDSKTMKIKVQNKALYLFQNSVVIMHTRIPIHLTQVPGVYRNKIWSLCMIVYFERHFYFNRFKL